MIFLLDYRNREFLFAALYSAPVDLISKEVEEDAIAHESTALISWNSNSKRFSNCSPVEADNFR